MDGNFVTAFEADRSRLRRIAYRLLGNSADADDAVQDTWIRLMSQDVARIDNLGGWLTTTLTRLCLDQLRRRHSRSESELDQEGLDALPEPSQGPAEHVELAQSVGLAMLVVLDTLEPAERVAFVLHDVFGVPFEQIADILGRLPAAARQLGSRGRRKLFTDRREQVAVERRHYALAESYLAASRNGDLAALLAILDPKVTLRIDASLGVAQTVTGAPLVSQRAASFRERAKLGVVAAINGSPGIAILTGEAITGAVLLRFNNGRIVEIELLADGPCLAVLDIIHE